MDGEFFWVVMLVLYLIFQVLGGRRKKKRRKAQQRRAEGATGRPAEMPPQRRTRTTTETPGRSAELDDALLEIRRALGFPDTSERRMETEAPVEARQTDDVGTSPEPTARTGLEAGPARRTESPPQRVRPATETPSRLPQPPKPTHLPARTRTFPARTKARSTSTAEVSLREKMRDQRISTTPMSGQRVDEKLSAAIDTATDTDSSRTDAVRSRLRDPRSLKEAFLLKEILDPPRSMRPLR